MEEISDLNFKNVIQGARRIYVQGSASTPLFLLDMLKESLSNEMDLSLYHIELGGGVFLFDPSVPLPKGLIDYSLFVGKNARKAVEIGRTQYIPMFLSEIPWFLRNHVKPDVSLINTTTPDRRGFVSLGPTVEATKVAVELSKIVVAQFNDLIPKTFGDSIISTNMVDYYLKCSQKPVESKREERDSADEKIGMNVAKLIPNEATIQSGIGRIPDAAMVALKDRKHLGIHTELFSDGMMDLVLSGAVDNCYKNTDRYQVVATFSKGEQKLYDFLDENPLIQMKSVEYTNDTSIIRKNSLTHSINSAVEVDVTGQISAESVGPRIISGVGGQMDFVRGASLSQGGKSIIAIRSKTNSGESKIVPTLKVGSGVTTTRNHVQFVVTEHGVADLRGKSIKERVEEMVTIADPKFMNQIYEESKKIYKL